MASTALTFNLYRVLRQQLLDTIDPAILNSSITPQQLQQWHLFAKYLIQASSHVKGRYDFAYIDRTGAMPSVLNVAYSKIPPFNESFQHRSFLDVSIDRAQELLSRDKTICVMWSGGVDSTLALASLVAQARHRDQIEILCSWESICEAGSLFDSVIKPWNLQIRFDQTRLNTTNPYTGDCGHELYVSGACGDQLFGPSNIRPWQPKPPFDDTWDHGYSQSFLDIVGPSVKLSPRPINTKRDIAWWMFFNFAWCTTRTDNQIMRPVTTANRCLSFFDSWDFQQWAVSTNSYYDNAPGYRKAEIQALRSLIDHDAYFVNKGKTNSVAWLQDPTWYIMDTEYRNYYTDDQTKQ